MLPGTVPAIGSTAAVVGPFRYLIFINETNTAGIRIRELGWYDGSSWLPSSTMTSDSAPSPLQVVYSSFNTFPGWQAYDNDTGGTSHWFSNNTGDKPIVLDLGAGNEITPTRIRIAPYYSSPTPEAPEDFSCYGSNDSDCFGSGPGVDSDIATDIAGATTTLLGSFSPGTSGWTTPNYREFTF